MCCFKTNPKPYYFKSKQTRKEKKIHIAKDPLACLEGLLKHWEAEDERPACLYLTNKTSAIFIGNKYLIM